MFAIYYSISEHSQQQNRKTKNDHSYSKYCMHSFGLLYILKYIITIHLCFFRSEAEFGQEVNILSHSYFLTRQYTNILHTLMQEIFFKYLSISRMISKHWNNDKNFLKIVCDNVYLVLQNIYGETTFVILSLCTEYNYLLKLCCDFGNYFIVFTLIHSLIYSTYI